MEFKNPNAPATKRQLYRLHMLTGKDTKDYKLTMEEASSQIGALDGINLGKQKIDWQPTPLEWAEYVSTPMSFADVRLFFGDQGQGKSISATACAIDNYYHYLVYVISPEGETLKAKSLNQEEKLYLQAPVLAGGLGIAYDNLKHVKVFNNDCTKSKIIALPQEYMVQSPVKIFANRTLYGIRYMYTDEEHLIGYINSPLMTNGWVILSESVMLDKRDTMTGAGKFMAWFGAECRKRHLRMAIDSQYPSMMQSRFHLFATSRVECSYDEDTTIVTLDVNGNSPVMESTSYVSYKYRRFFDTDEHMKIAQGKINKAVATVAG